MATEEAGAQNIIRPAAVEESRLEAGQETVAAETPSRGPSVLGLIRSLTNETRAFIRQEIQLAKTEISENLSRMRREAVMLAAGGALAYGGLIVLLVGLGWLVAWAIHLAGLNPLFAVFLGMIAIGLLVVTAGGLLLLQALNTLSKSSLSPERTVHTLQELRGKPVAPQPQGPVSSAEMQSRVEATQGRMGETLDELGRRLSPQHINAEVKQRIQKNPYRAGLIAMGAGVLSGLVLRRKFRHAE